MLVARANTTSDSTKETADAAATDHDEAPATPMEPATPAAGKTQRLGRKNSSSARQQRGRMDATRFYRTIDRVEGLRVQIVLFKVEDADAAAETVTAAGATPSPASPYLSASLAGRRLAGRLEVMWQEKVPGPVSASAATDLATASVSLGNQTVHAKLAGRKGLKNSERRPRGYQEDEAVLFTLVDGEREQRQAEVDGSRPSLVSGIYTDRNGIADEMLALSFDAMSLERQVTNRNADSQDTFLDFAAGGSSGRSHVGDSLGSWRKAAVEGNVSEMHLMASIPLERDYTTPFGGGGAVERKEIRLCSLRFYSSGMLAVTPDFLAEGSAMYRFRVGKASYEYIVAHVSGGMSPEEESREQAIFQEFHGRHLMAQREFISRPFQQSVDPGHFRRYVRGEIVSAQGFQGDWIYFEYSIECGDASQPTKESRLSGTSQVAQNVPPNSGLTFSLPFEVLLICDVNTETRSELLIKVMSVDAWDRHVVQGYTRVEIPSTLGQHDMRIASWRPIQQPVNRMRTFFLGGSAEIQDLAYLKSKAGQKAIENKYGFETETSGTFHIRIDIAEQRSIHGDYDAFYADQ
ncbi:ciliary basal body-associated, B9 protein-domain-containing protein [Entophlyctis helioformis]|nr:ciliary basal body-associated, B9 protein-domain-containing protein [Entophlyctis helioformis]